MQLTPVAGSTYCIDGVTVTGVYVFEDRSCLLVDSGAGPKYAAEILDLLRDSGLTVRALLITHAHPDHCGGSEYIRERSGCSVLASPIEAAVMENPVLAPAALFSAAPPRFLMNRHLVAQPSRVTARVAVGDWSINGVSFRLLDLKGHTLGQVGLVTSDGVAFLGDSLIDRSILAEYRWLCLADVGGALETIDGVARAGYRRAILSHGGLQQDLGATIGSNRELIQRVIEFILLITRSARDREQIASEIIAEFELPLNRMQYLLIQSTVSAFLSYLCDGGMVRASIERQRLLFRNVATDSEKTTTTPLALPSDNENA